MDKDQAPVSPSALLDKNATKETLRNSLTRLSAKKIPNAALSSGKYSPADIADINLALRSLEDVGRHIRGIQKGIRGAFETMSISDSEVLMKKAIKSELLSFSEWSDVCHWMVALNTICVTEKRLGNFLMFATLRIISQMIISVAWLSDIRKWTLKRRDLILVLIRHWVDEDKYTRDSTLNWTVRHFAHSLGELIHHIEFESTTKGTVKDFLESFTSAVEGGAGTITNVALQQLHTMLELKNPDLQVADLCLQLINHFSRNAATRAHLLQKGIIKATAQFLALLDPHPPPSGPQPLQHFFMESVNVYLKYMETANGPATIAKALDEGILGSFLKAWPWVMRFGSNLPGSFFGYLVPFLTYRSVLRSFSAALRQVDELGLDIEMMSKCKEWKTFSLSVTDRLQLMSKFNERIATLGSCSCENLDCYLRSTTVQYRRCSGCSTVLYCSRLCQKSDWPRHRVICKAIQKQLSEGTQLPISHHDRGFIHYLIVQNMDRYCAQLRKRAKKEFPSALLSSLLVTMLFFGNLNPPIVGISLAATHTWDDDERPEMETLLERAREREGRRTLVTAMVREGYSDDIGSMSRVFPFLLFHSDNWLVKHPSSWGDEDADKMSLPL